jgi:hypothetical protein
MPKIERYSYPTHLEQGMDAVERLRAERGEHIRHHQFCCLPHAHILLLCRCHQFLLFLHHRLDCTRGDRTEILGEYFNFDLLVGRTSFADCALVIPSNGVQVIAFLHDHTIPLPAGLQSAVSTAILEQRNMRTRTIAFSAKVLEASAFSPLDRPASMYLN